MQIVDLILILGLAGFIFYGLFFGLIRSFGSLAGLLAGLWVAIMLTGPVAAWGQSLFFGFNSIGRTVVFFLIFTIANRLVVFGFVMLDHAFDLISIIPFLKTINRLAGAIFGLLLGATVISLIIYVALATPMLGVWMTGWLAKSSYSKYFIGYLATIQPILPQVFTGVKTLITKL